MLKNILKYIYKKIIPLSVTIICLYALFLRIKHLYGHLILWDDERFQLSQMQRTFLELLKSLQKCDCASLLEGDHYLIYPFFKIFSYNKLGLAMPHIVITIIGFYLLYLICKRYFKSVWAYLITFSIVCFNATLINHATEIRPYAVLPTLALGVFYLFQRIADLNFKLSILKRITAGIFFILVIWFHVYGILIFTGCFLFTLLDKYKEKDFKIYFRNMISFTAIILCFAMPFWLYCILGPRLRVNLNVFELIPNPFYDITGFLKAIFCNLIGAKKLYFLSIGMIIPFVFSYEKRYRQLLFLFCNVIMPIVFIFIFDILGKNYFLQRQFIWVMPLFAFFLGWAWDSLFTLLRPDARVGVNTSG